MAAILVVILRFFKNITVEPIGFLGYISMNVNQLASLIFTLDAVCLQHYGNNQTVDCKNQSEEVEHHVQTGAVFWMTWTTVLMVPVIVVATLILGNVFVAIASAA